MKQVFLGLIFLAAGACAPGHSASQHPEMATVANEGTRVEVAAVFPSEATLRLSLTGEVKGARDANLSSAQGGFVESVRVRTGATVRKGETLLAIDRELHAAGARQAQAQADLARVEHERLVRVGDGVSESQLQQAHTQSLVADAALSQAQVRLRRASITAPFDGVVSAIDVEEGEVVGPGSPLLRLVQLDPARVRLSVSDRDVVSLAPGQPATVTAGALGGQLQGTVREISPVGDGKTRSFHAEVEVENPDRRLLPGMVARVDTTSSLGEAIVVPSDWVISTPEGFGVFVEEAGAARWRPVVLGRVIQSRVLVDEGLSAADRVIMVGHRELIDGDRVLVGRSGRCCELGRVVYDSAEQR